MTAIVATTRAKQAVAQTSNAEQTLWKLEHSYWRYVEANDLENYRNLWDKNFLGWPYVSPAPVHKDHITDWITSQTDAGKTFKMIDFKPATVQVTGNIGVACYWIIDEFVDASGQGAPQRSRILHTWQFDGHDWYIISGMSMPEANVAP